MKATVRQTQAEVPGGTTLARYFRCDVPGLPVKPIRVSLDIDMAEGGPVGATVEGLLLDVSGNFVVEVDADAYVVCPTTGRKYRLVEAGDE